MTPPSYIVVPAGELLGPYWQAIMRLPDGYKIVCVALQLRDMAVLCNAGGAICHPSGKPLSMTELAAVLRVDMVWLEPVLQRVLAPAGLVAPLGEEGWGCTDPTLDRHFQRLAAGSAKADGQEPPVLTLEAEPAGETKVERNLRLGRNRKRRADYRRRWGRAPEDERYVQRDRSVTPALPDQVTLAVTHGSQHVDFRSRKTALPNKMVCYGSTPSSYPSHDDDGDDQQHPDLTPLLQDIPPAERGKLSPRIHACLVAGHPIHVVQQTISAARRESSSGRPWIGLGHHKLSELARATALPPAPPPKTTASTADARPDPTPVGRAAFEAIYQMEE